MFSPVLVVISSLGLKEGWLEKRNGGKLSEGHYDMGRGGGVDSSMQDFQGEMA